MIKPHILFDNNKLSIKIKNFVKKKLGHYAIAKSDLIVVIGGDGFMLGSLKKYYKYNKKFYGCLLYTSPSPRDVVPSRMPSSA